MTLDFLATGGDSILPNPYAHSPPPLASQEEVFTEYIKRFSPLDVVVEGRIVVTDRVESELQPSIRADNRVGGSLEGERDGWLAWWSEGVKLARWD